MVFLGKNRLKDGELKTTNVKGRIARSEGKTESRKPRNGREKSSPVMPEKKSSSEGIRERIWRQITQNKQGRSSSCKLKTTRNKILSKLKNGEQRSGREGEKQR